MTASVLGESNVTCNGGNDGTISIEYGGGVGPYSVEWLGGYNPDALPAGMYQVTVYDANLCSVTLDSILITEPGPFGLSLQATVPECTDAQSGTIEATVRAASGTSAWTGEASIPMPFQLERILSKPLTNPDASRRLLWWCLLQTFLSHLTFWASPAWWKAKVQLTTTSSRREAPTNGPWTGQQRSS